MKPAFINKRGGGETARDRAWEVMAVAVLLSIILFSLHRIASFDYWTHLAFGKLYLQKGATTIPEPFISGMENTVMDATEWPFQILLYLVQTTFGHGGVSLAAALLAVVAAYPLLSSTKRKGAAGLAAMAFIAAVFFVIRGRYAARPEIIVYALVVLSALLANGWAVKPRLMPLLILLPVFLIWAPLHVSWTVGASIILLILMAEPNLPFWKELVQTARGRAAAAVFGIFVIIALWSSLKFAFSVLKDMTAGGRMAFINEMLPIWRFPEIAIPFALVAAPALVMAWGNRKGRTRRIAQWVASLLMAIAVARNYGLSLLFMAPPALEGFFQYRLYVLDRHKNTLLAAGLAMLALFTALGFRDADPAWGLGADKDLFPVDSAAFHKSANLPAPVFNGFDIGGYLNYAWEGNPRTYIDGRSTLPPGRTPVFQEITNSADPFPRLDSEGINSVVSRGVFQNSGRIFPVVEALLQSPDWKLLRATDALVFARAKMVREIPPVPGPDGWRFMARECEMLMGRGRSGPHFDYTLGVSLLMSGDLENGKRLLQNASASHPELKSYYAKYLFKAGIGF